MADIIHCQAERRSREWSAACRNLIIGSDIGAILGMSRYRTADDVRARKLGLVPREPRNAAMDHGILHEDEARADLIEFLGLPEALFQPCGIFVRDGWIGAIPDGLVGDAGVIEIKTPYSAAKNSKPLQPITDEYFAQVQGEMYCSDRRWAFFWQWTPTRQRLDIITRDDAWIERNLPTLRKFWESLYG